MSALFFMESIRNMKKLKKSYFLRGVGNPAYEVEGI